MVRPEVQDAYCVGRSYNDGPQSHHHCLYCSYGEQICATTRQRCGSYLGDHKAISSMGRHSPLSTNFKMHKFKMFNGQDTKRDHVIYELTYLIKD